MLAGKRGGHGDDEGVGGLGARRRGELAGGDGAADQDVEVGLDDVHLALVDEGDGFFVDIDAKH